MRTGVLALVLAVLYLVGLGQPELLDPDESRHAEIAREMLAGGRFITPHLYGESYHDKPVAFHWTVAVSLALFGHGTAAARLPSALAALCTLAVTFWWAQRLYGAATAGIATLGLATSGLFLAVGRLATVDMLFVTILTAAVAWISVAVDEPRSMRRSLMPFYALVGAACLVKGPIAIVLSLPCLLAVHVTLAAGEASSPTRPVLGATVLCAVVAPWYLAAWRAEPDYIETFLGLHNVARFFGTADLGHDNSLAYYALSLPLALLPWTPLLACGLWACLRQQRRPSEATALIWLASVFAVFGAASTRLITYLLPAFPALFVVACGAIAPLLRQRSPSWLEAWVRTWGSVVAIATLAAAVAAVSGLPLEERTVGISATACLSAVCYAVALWCRRRPAPALRSVLLLATSTFVAGVGAYGPVADLLTTAKGYRQLASALTRGASPAHTITSLARAPHALSFYMQAPIGRVPDLGAAREHLAAATPALLLTKRRYADLLLGADESVDVDLWWRNSQGTSLLGNAAATAAWRRREGVEPSADLDGRHHGFEDRSGHRTRSLSMATALVHP